MKKEPRNMSQLFDKLNDLKSVFVYGQRIIPIIQSLIDFMKDTVPLLENINKSIEHTASQMPSAQNQIKDVTNATEVATTEILDRVDEISSDLNEAGSKMNELLENAVKKDIAIDELINKYPELKEELDHLRYNGSKEIVESLVKTLNKIGDNTYSITLSLQVQDITSQQLSAVNHLITSVQHRLSSLINDIDQTEMDKIEKNFNKEITFDADASYTRDESNQSIADEMFDAKQKETTSQDEIDKLFSS